MEEERLEVIEPEATESEGIEEDANDAPEEEAPLAPEDLARRLFASYLEPSEIELAPMPEAEAGIDSEDLPADVSVEPIDESVLKLFADEEGEEGEATDEPTGEEEPEGEESPEGRNWFVVHSYSGYENKVKKNLEHRIESLGMQDKIFQVLVPTEEEIELKDGQRRTVERRIFPGYILVEMLMDEDSWYVVRNTPGVTGFVGSIRRPTPLRKRDVDRILKRMRAETPRVKVTFRPGQKVRICDGPFEDFVGSVDDIYPDKGKVRILVSFFGRETPVELDFLQVEKI